MRKLIVYLGFVTLLLNTGACSLFLTEEEYDLLRVQREMRSVNHRIEKITKSIELLAQAVRQHTISISQLTVQKDAIHTALKDQLNADWKKAISTANHKDYDQAISLFKTIQKDYPDSNRSAIAAIWLLHLKEKSRAVPLQVVQHKPKVRQKPLMRSNARPSGKLSQAGKFYYPARDLYREHKYEKAIELLEQLVYQFPQSRLADNAYYWKGECQYSMNQYYAAKDTFEHIVSNYQKGNKFIAALLKAGYSYHALGDYQNARSYFLRIINTYPDSPAAQKAQRKLDQMPLSEQPLLEDSEEELLEPMDMQVELGIVANKI